MSELVGRTPAARIRVNISRNTELALLTMCEREHISLTEALRRLVGYGALVYEATAAGKQVVVQDGPRNLPLLLLDPPRSWGRLPTTGEWLVE